MMRVSLFLICCFTVALCLVGSRSAFADDRGADVMDQLQKKFGGIKTLSARFDREHFWKIMDQHNSIQGRLFVERPRRFRFETKSQIVVTDGETAWNYAPANEQVLISDYNTIEKDRSFEKLLFDLILLGGYAESYSPSYLGEKKIEGKRCHLVELTAKLEDTYIVDIKLWIDRRLWVVRKVEYNYLNGDITTFDLSDLVIDKDIDPAKFGFSMPENVEAIDLR
ncbi:MAG: outer membrane lipoprotein carrier protein LolA [bacterium]|nr:outer membrane lipoprotein carrier protein LolA [bacterium]